MSKFRAIKALALSAVVVGVLGFSGGCGGDAVATGSVVTEDLKATRDREKLIAEQYKKKPRPVPSRR